VLCVRSKIVHWKCIIIIIIIIIIVHGRSSVSHTSFHTLSIFSRSQTRQNDVLHTRTQPINSYALLFIVFYRQFNEYTFVCVCVCNVLRTLLLLYVPTYTLWLIRCALCSIGTYYTLLTIHMTPITTLWYSWISRFGSDSVTNSYYVISRDLFSCGCAPICAPAFT